jgi:AraC family transcriptional regulator
MFGVSPCAYRVRGLHVVGEQAAGVHAATVASVAPCVGLYRVALSGRSEPVPVDIVVKDMPTVHALVVRRRVGRDEIAEGLAACIPMVFAHAQRNGLALTGPPFARYHEIGIGSLVVEGGVPVAAPAVGEPAAGIEPVTIPAGPAAVAMHVGPYERLTETYRMIEAWLDDQGRAVAGPPMERYLTDPGERPDPETWETEIVQPIK